MQTQMITFTAPTNLVNAFDLVIKKRAKTRSDFYREAMQQFLHEEALFDQVFTSGQKQTKKLGLKVDDVDRLVHEVHKGI